MLEKSSVSNVLLARRRRNNKMGEAGICSAQLRIGGAVGGANNNYLEKSLHTIYIETKMTKNAKYYNLF
jgi:hypothetical protein